MTEWPRVKRKEPRAHPPHHLEGYWDPLEWCEALRTGLASSEMGLTSVCTGETNLAGNQGQGCQLGQAELLCGGRVGQVHIL